MSSDEEAVHRGSARMLSRSLGRHGLHAEVTGGPGRCSGESGGGLSLVTSPLDNPNVKGIPLEQGLAKAREGIVLPNDASLGVATKVLVDETPGLARNEIGLLIAYGSGINVYFKPLSPSELPDFHAQLEATRGAEYFADGREQPFDIVLVDGVEVAARRAGTVVNDYSGHEIPMEAQVQWCVDDGIYVLKSKTQNVEQLFGIARSMIARGARPSTR